MDPVSIAAASASLVGSCLTISNYIYVFVNKTKFVDTAIRLLGIEIDTFQQVLGSISSSFSDPMISKVTQTSPERQHWKNVKRSMDDCRETLRSLEEIWEGVSGSHPRFLGRVRKAIKLESKISEITFLKEQIVAYRRTMNLSLQVITISSVLNNREISDNTVSRLENMSADIRQLLQLFSSRPQRPHRDSSRVLTNLEECVRSAKIYVDTATSIANSRSTITGSKGSVFADDIDETRKSLFNKWITESNTILEDRRLEVSDPSTSTKVADKPINLRAPAMNHEHDMIPTTTSEGTTQSISRYDVKLKLLEMWRVSANEKYKTHEYNEAKSFLEKLVQRSEEKFGTKYDGRNRLLEMLGMCYCWLQEWDNAEKIITVQFDGREKVIEVLAVYYLRHEKFDEAEKVLLSSIQDESLAERHVELTSILSEVYLEKKDFKTALQWAERTYEERVDTVGSKHVLFFLSLLQLARIYEATGDTIEAHGYRSLLPPGIQECYDIQRLCNMRPDHAVDEAQALVPTRLLDDDEQQQWLNDHLEDGSVWKEISANIVNGELGITGSGHGLTFLHAFAWTGHELAVELLLERGTDFDATTSKMGWTALHIAISNSDSAIAAKLIERQADLEVKDRKGFTPLILAAACGNLEGVKLLLDNGAHINAHTNNGDTALIVSIKEKFLEIINLLLDRGADAEVKNRQGETALFIAARRGWIEIVKELLDYGVEREINYVPGMKPRDIALRNQHDLVVELLETSEPQKKPFLRRFIPKKDKHLAEHRNEKKVKVRRRPMTEETKRNDSAGNVAERYSVGVFNASRLQRIV